jgi:hypothetical protein
MRAPTLLLPATLLLTGCLTTGMYRTAHVLPQGEGDFAINFSVVRATLDDPRESAPGTTTFTYPNVLPELSYHYGISENVEVGGRFALGAGMIELDTKYRLLRSRPLHLAVQPAVGYRSLGFIEGFHGALPIILTHDLTPSISLNTSLFGSYTRFATTDSVDTDDLDLSGDSVNLGGGVGIQFRTPAGFHFMPALEIQRSVHRGGDARDAP